MSTHTTSAEQVLTYWFGEPVTGDADVLAKVRRWFQGGPEMDREVIAQFGSTVEAALRGDLDDWAATPRGRLALVIVLDQFTRNAFRNDPKTYAGDPKAQALALDAFDQGMDQGLTYVERMFLAMPLLHSENLALQQRSRALTSTIDATVPPEYRAMAAMHTEQAAKYLAVIERFGRFPHRNAILGRPNTADEEEFLKDWHEKSAPKRVSGHQ